ncbi:hypothetical protein DIPPA_14101 [Diplonema papillatum]|nr:hypothetical protein DIPPA_14101 [Diplonema papillatum]
MQRVATVLVLTVHACAAQRTFSVFSRDLLFAEDRTLEFADASSVDTTNLLASRGIARLNVSLEDRIFQGTFPKRAFNKRPFAWDNAACDYGQFPVPLNGSVGGYTDFACGANGLEGSCRLLVFDPTEHMLFELGQADISGGASDGHPFYSGCAAYWNTGSTYGWKVARDSYGRGQSCRSAVGSGLPVYPFLFTADDLAAGAIGHALGFTLPGGVLRAGTYIFPASSTSTFATAIDNAAPVMGMHFRLRTKTSLRVSHPHVNFSALSNGANVVLNTLQAYGMFLVAVAADFSILGVNDQHSFAKYRGTGGSPLFAPDELSFLSPEDFEVLDNGGQPQHQTDCVLLQPYTDPNPLTYAPSGCRYLLAERGLANLIAHNVSCTETSHALAGFFYGTQYCTGGEWTFATKCVPNRLQNCRTEDIDVSADEMPIECASGWVLTGWRISQHISPNFRIQKSCCEAPLLLTAVDVATACVLVIGAPDVGRLEVACEPGGALRSFSLVNDICPLNYRRYMYTCVYETQTREPSVSVSPYTTHPDTNAPRLAMTPGPETTSPATSRPDTHPPETPPPETFSPKTPLPETYPPQTSAPAAQSPKPTPPETSGPTETSGTSADPPVTPQPENSQNGLDVPGAANATLDSSTRSKDFLQLVQSLSAVSILSTSPMLGLRTALAAQACGWFDEEGNEVDYPGIVHPTQWVVAGSASAGVVVGNCVAGVALSGLYYILSFGFNPKTATATRTEEAFSFVFAFPSAPLFVQQILYAGAVCGSVRVLFFGMSTTLVLGVLSFCTMAACIVLPLMQLRMVKGHVPAHAVYRYVRKHEHLAVSWLVGRGEWVSRRPASFGWARRFGSVIRAYRQEYAGYATVEFAACFFQAVATALEPNGTIGCGHVRLATGVLFTASFLLEVLLFPQARVVDRVLVASAYLLAAVAMYLLAVAYYMSAAAGIADDLLLLSTILHVIKVIINLSVEAYVVQSGRRRRLQGECSKRKRRRKDLKPSEKPADNRDTDPSTGSEQDTQRRASISSLRVISTDTQLGVPEFKFDFQDNLRGRRRRSSNRLRLLSPSPLQPINDYRGSLRTPPCLSPGGMSAASSDRQIELRPHRTVGSLMQPNSDACRRSTLTFTPAMSDNESFFRWQTPSPHLSPLNISNRSVDLKKVGGIKGLAQR